MNSEANLQEPVEIVELIPADSNHDKSVFEKMLSPQSLGWMMALGGGMLVLGFAIWLWSIGVFENPITLAVTIGTINVSLLGLGIWLLKGTRYQIAGKGITLLCSLALPLNLWLYDSQGLITVANGKLWIPAFLISIGYAAIARITKESSFVYTLVGGIATTGILFLAGTPGQLFWAALPIATLLATIGSISIFVDRLFVENDGAFARKNFGLAFFRAGHVVLILGLGLLFAEYWTTLLLSANKANLWTLGLLGLSASTYYFSNTGDRKHWLFNVLSVICFAWAAFVGFRWLEIEITIRMALLLFNLLWIAANVARHFLRFNSEVAKAIHFAFGFAFSAVTTTFCFGTLALSPQILFADWMCAAQLAAAAMVLLTIPGIWSRKLGPAVSVIVILGVGGMTLSLFSAAIGIGAGLNLSLIAAAATALAIGLVSTVQTGFNKPLGNLATGVGSMALLIQGYLWIAQACFDFESLTSIVTILLIAAACGTVNFSTGSRTSLSIGSVAILLNVFQFAVLFDLLNGYAITSSITIVGLLLLAIAKLNARFQKRDFVSTSMSVQDLANSLILIGVAGANLFILAHVLNSSFAIGQLALLFFNLKAIGAAAACTREIAWRRGFLAAAIVTVILGIIVHFNLSTLTVAQRIEIGSFVLGTLMVVAGYFGWMREGSDQDDAVSFNLVMGSFLLVAPLAYGIISDRVTVDAALTVWRYVHEIGAITAGLLLLGTGILCRIRSTTIAGGLLTFIFVFSNVLLIELPERLQTTSAMMMIGGGLFFGSAVLLSIYRDRLLALPSKVREGKGVFQVLKWR